MAADAGAEVIELRTRRRRSDEHAVAARAMHLLDHQVLQIRQHELAFRLAPQHPGLHVGQQRFLIQIEAHHVRHVRVDRLVIGDAGADGVSDRDVASAVGGQQPRHAERGIGAER
jgi:hypothetical protein